MSTRTDNTSGNASKKSKMKMKANRQKKYEYEKADAYPDSSFRHVPCVGAAKGWRGVPADMGWLWTLAQRKGWRPGALGKSVKKWMTLKVISGGATLQLSRKKKSETGVGKGKGGKKDECADGEGGGKFGKGGVNEYGSAGRGKDDIGRDGDFGYYEDDESKRKAALKVNKVKDSIFITIHPLKQLLNLADGENPFVDCDPIIFKLIQPPSAKTIAHRLAKEKRKYEEDVRKTLDQALQNICQCAYEDVYCTDMAALDGVIENSPPSLHVPPYCSCGVAVSETEDSDWDLEYTPPYAMTGMKPKRPVMVHVETQWSDTDTNAQSKSNKLKWKRKSQSRMTATMSKSALVM